MPGKMNVWLANPNYRFGNNAFLPYAIGRLWAYAIKSEAVQDDYRLAGWVIFRDDISAVLQAMAASPPDILAVSAYIWNIGYIEALTAAVKSRWPGCLIIAGGPQVPDPQHFSGKSFADILINGEGEVAFRDELIRYARNRCIPPAPIHTGEKARIADLAELESPYLAGLFDHFISDRSYNWHALQETNRGCPYQCTFCDWGSATFSQVRQFPLEVIYAEIDWFARNRIELLYNCDANFGMLKRDVDIARRLAANKASCGNPKLFRAAYAKKTTPQVYETALILANAGMSKGVTLSVQSMDETVLKTVKRRAIDEPEYQRLVAEYKSQGVPTYTEIILGLPNETMFTFRRGIDRLLQLGQHEGINIYPAILLQNSQMNDPEYRREHRIQVRRVPMLLLHGSPASDPAPEEYDLIIETASMNRSAWINCMVFGWAVQGLHCLGFLRQWAMNRAAAGKSYSEIYADLIYESKILKSIIHDLRQSLIDTIDGVGNWNQVDPKFGDVIYPPEELLFMRAVMNSDEIYGQLRLTNSEKNACRDEYVDHWEYPNLHEWARESVWYARKGNRKRRAA